MVQILARPFFSLRPFKKLGRMVFWKGSADLRQSPFLGRFVAHYLLTRVLNRGFW